MVGRKTLKQARCPLFLAVSVVVEKSATKLFPTATVKTVRKYFQQKEFSVSCMLSTIPTCLVQFDFVYTDHTLSTSSPPPPSSGLSVAEALRMTYLLGYGIFGLTHSTPSPPLTTPVVQCTLPLFVNAHFSRTGEKGRTRHALLPLSVADVACAKRGIDQFF